MTDRSAIGRKSRRKGSMAELEITKLLQAQGYDARKGYQHDGKEVADVVGLPGIHIEVKRVEKLNLTDALRQAIRDARPGELPAVFHRRNRETWRVTMTLDHWLELYEKALEDKG